MLPKLVLLIAVCLTLSPATSGAKRRSRIDTPIKQAADAPLTDNIATASGSEPQAVKVELPPVTYEVPEFQISNAATVAEENTSEEECDPDMIGFEVITG